MYKAAQNIVSKTHTDVYPSTSISKMMVILKTTVYIWCSGMNMLKDSMIMDK